MVKKAAALALMLMLVCSVALPSFARGDEKEAKKDRVEGRVVRSSPDKMTLTVRVRDMEAEKTVHYDASTKWTSQYHGDKNVNAIDASQVKDGDQVICLGTYDDKGVLQATTISKRLSHSSQ